jgi:hypothetical protein
MLWHILREMLTGKVVFQKESEIESEKLLLQKYIRVEVKFYMHLRMQSEKKYLCVISIFVLLIL